MAKNKKKNLKSSVLDTAFFVGGVVLGELIAHLVRNVGFLKWLSFEVSGTLDLVLISISVHLNPAVVLFPLLGVVIGRMLRGYMSESRDRRSASSRNEESEDEDDEQNYDA